MFLHPLTVFVLPHPHIRPIRAVPVEQSSVTVRMKLLTLPSFVGRVSFKEILNTLGKVSIRWLSWFLFLFSRNFQGPRLAEAGSREGEKSCGGEMQNSFWVTSSQRFRIKRTRVCEVVCITWYPRPLWYFLPRSMTGSEKHFSFSKIVIPITQSSIKLNFGIKSGVCTPLYLATARAPAPCNVELFPLVWKPCHTSLVAK